MSDIVKFDFDRSRGIIWVCDLSKSSSFLNDSELIDDIEVFLPRFHWTASILIKSLGGIFIDWTGDGFLAWFETKLDRDKQKVSNKIGHAAWHLSFLVNVTQLGVKSKRKFKIRHGITYEKDALITNILKEDGHKSINIIGRAVVLAFRISSKQSFFPSIIIQKEILPNNSIGSFKKWTPTKDELMKYFKGEKWGTTTLYSTVDKVKSKQKNTSIDSLEKGITKVINEIEDSKPIDDDSNFLVEFIKKMQAGPKWSKRIIREEIKFLEESMFASLKNIQNILKKKKST